MHKHKRAQKIKGTGASGKVIIQGLLQRGGEARMTIVPTTDELNLQGTIHRHVEKGSQVYSDAATGYRGLDKHFLHESIDHLTKYVSGQVHTNGLENFWSLLKRGLKGTYVAVAPFHLGRYVDEQLFRYNRRKVNDRARWIEVMSAVVGRRVTWRQLTTQGDAGFMGIK